MKTPFGERSDPGTASTNGPDAGARRTEELLRELIEQAVRNRAPRVGAAEAPGDEVLLAAEMDGVRCVLMRTPPPSPGAASLSPREREIARMVAKGLADKTIAAVLDISRYTVSTHLRRMYCKLGVTSRAALVARVMADGSL